jgi:enterochelin esterase-like enzyme
VLTTASGGWIRRHRWLSLAFGIAVGTLVLPGLLSRPAPLPLRQAAAIASRSEEAAAGNSTAEVAEHTFWSSALGREMPYTVFLPPGYTSSSTTSQYPVLYMLHGLGGDHVIEWRAYGIFEDAEALMRAGTIEPMIIVLPEGEDGYWMDHADGGPAWGTYVARDLILEIDARFHTIARPQARAVGGNSMGGHGAAQLAMNFPARFGVVGIHSPTLRSFDTAPAYFGDRDYFEAHDPLSLMQRYPQTARRLQVWLDVGEQDPWLDIVVGFDQEMTDLGVVHEFHVYSGPHDDEYWTANLGAYLEFYSRALAHDTPDD